MNHLHSDTPMAKYTKEELAPIADRLEWGTCNECGKDVVVSRKGVDYFDFIKTTPFDDDCIPSGFHEANGARLCGTCSHKRSETRDAKLRPRYARRLVAKVKPIYKCPMHQCGFEASSKKEVEEHLLAQGHSLFYMEEELGVRHKY